MKKIIKILIILLSLVLTGACKKSEEVDGSGTAIRQQMERTAGYTAATVTDLSNTVYRNSIGIVENITDTTDTASNEFSYDANTGWWTFSINLNNSQSAEVRVKFVDSSGNFHKFFSPNTQHIETTGTGSSPEGSFDWDLIITGLGLGNSSFIINGSGTATYQSTSCTYTVENMTIEKLGDGIPESGNLVIRVDGITFTITFNGTQYVQVTYSYNNRSYTITINLETGQIT